jgi:hypothetical protein
MDDAQPEEEVLAINIAIDGVRHCLHVCGIMTPLAQDAVIAEGFVDIMSFAELCDKDIHEHPIEINASTAFHPVNMGSLHRFHTWNKFHYQ